MYSLLKSEKEDDMSLKQIFRLSEWLKIRGLTAEDFDECLFYISTGFLPAEKGEKNQAPPTDSNE